MNPDPCPPGLSLGLGQELIMKISYIEQPRKTFFYERKDGFVFACGLEEAYNCHDRFKQVGVSDGKHYWDTLNEIRKVVETLPDEEVKKMMLKAYKEEIEIARGHFEDPKIDTSSGGMSIRTVREGTINLGNIMK